jgi:hypothetical protein
LTIWSDNNSISGFSVRGFTTVNVYLIGSDYNEIFNMDISYAGHYGQANLEIFSSSNNIIRDSNFVDGRIGLRILDILVLMKLIIIHLILIFTLV